MPGIFVQTIVFGSLTTGVGLADDLQKGLIDRFRSLPMARSAVLVGRTLADLVRNFFVVLLMAVVGYLVGWRPNTSVLAVGAALVLVLAFSYSLSWMFAIVGLMVRDRRPPRRPRSRSSPRSSSRRRRSFRSRRCPSGCRRSRSTSRSRS